jgi:hypothetical protein
MTSGIEAQSANPSGHHELPPAHIRQHFGHLVGLVIFVRFFQVSHTCYFPFLVVSDCSTSGPPTGSHHPGTDRAILGTDLVDTAPQVIDSYAGRGTAGPSQLMPVGTLHGTY